MQKLELGIITKPQGLKGDFRVRLNSTHIPGIDNIQHVFVNNLEYKVEKTASRDKFYIFKLEGINSCEEAEDLRNVKIYYEFDENQPLEDGEYYIADLIGCKIAKENGVLLGTISNVLTNSGSTDVICFVDNNNKEFMFPFVSDVFKNVDIELKNIIVNSKRLEEILVWELIF